MRVEPNKDNTASFEGFFFFIWAKRLHIQIKFSFLLFLASGVQLMPRAFLLTFFLSGFTIFWKYKKKKKAQDN